MRRSSTHLTPPGGFRTSSAPPPPLVPCRQAPDGSLRPATGSRRMDLELPAGLEPLARFGEGEPWVQVAVVPRMAGMP